MLAGSPYVDNTVSGGATYAYKIARNRDDPGLRIAADHLRRGEGRRLHPAADVRGAGKPHPDGAASTCSVGLSWAAGTAQCAGPV